VQHKRIADYWNEIAPKHGPVEQFQWHRQWDEFWDAYRILGVEQILNQWAIEETKRTC
jgi:hypothetical protein